MREFKLHHLGQLLWFVNQKQTFSLINPFGEHIIIHIFTNPNFTLFITYISSKLLCVNHYIVLSGDVSIIAIDVKCQLCVTLKQKQNRMFDYCSPIELKYVRKSLKQSLK